LNSEELIRKETIHEVGHILGLGHCENDCVMRFSNSLQEAIEKSDHLCSVCREKLQRMHEV
ncbi:MAG TPA: peptidase, partial [Thermoplasmatales archaeon]|nr:peptidase [Thermoplasmatales archaeon]